MSSPSSKLMICFEFNLLLLRKDRGSVSVQTDRQRDTHTIPSGNGDVRTICSMHQHMHKNESYNTYIHDSIIKLTHIHHNWSTEHTLNVIERVH